MMRGIPLTPELRTLRTRLSERRESNRDKMEQPDCTTEELYRMRGENGLIRDLIKEPVKTGSIPVTYLDEANS